VALDSTYAETRYLRGIVRDRAGDVDGARSDYRAAREYDAVPFRAPAAIKQAIRDAAGVRGVMLVDVDSLFAAHSPQGIAGAEFFLEHLHPNLSGHALIAGRIARELSAQQWAATGEKWQWERDLPPRQYIEFAGVTELDLAIRELRIHMLTQKWPYRRDGGVPNPFVSTREQRVADLAEEFVRKGLPLNEAHRVLGDHYLEIGRGEDALREFRSAFAMFPLDPRPALQLGQLLLRTGRPRPARYYLDLALALAPDSEAAILLLMQALAAEGNLGGALRLGDRALELHPESQAAHALVDALRAVANGSSAH
jgi:tetratricopeptide (TPR) repeat protein